MFNRQFFCVLEITYSQDATTDIDAKYVKKTRFCARMCLLGVAKSKSDIYTPFSQKPAILGPNLDGTWKFPAEKQL